MQSEKRKVKPMDKLSKRLKEDAAAIDAPVSKALRERIDASLNAVDVHAAGTGAPRARGSLSWASGLVGVALAAVLIAVLNRLPADRPVEEFSATPPFLAEIPNPVGLRLRNADLTEPLQEELNRLRADLDKARETLEQDIGITF
jgi:hypothetical protein